MWGGVHELGPVSALPLPACEALGDAGRGVSDLHVFGRGGAGEDVDVTGLGAAAGHVEGLPEFVADGVAGRWGEDVRAEFGEGGTG